MQQRIITLLCAASLAISAPALASELKLRQDAPNRYVVKKGDTLWGIAGKYLHRPWQWGRLWGANRSKIRNPDLIYPGQVLVLRYVNGKPRLSVEGGGRRRVGVDSSGIPVEKLTPRVREVSSGYGIQAVNVDFYRMFMQHPQIINQRKTQYAPRLVGDSDNRIMYSKGDRVYAYKITEPGRYLVYRVQKDIIDPETKKFLGQQVVFSGIVATLPATNSALEARSAKDAEQLQGDEYYTRRHPMVKLPTQTAQPVVIEEAVSEIRNGDYLLKLNEDPNRFNMMPHEPNQRVDARVVSIFDGISEAGQFQTITLNKGGADGLDKGAVVSIYKRSRRLKTDLVEKDNDGRRSVVKYLSIPAEEVALAMVYNVSDHLSSAIILEGMKNVSVGDTVSNPGQDLDNMPYEDRHVPNAPQDPHETGADFISSPISNINIH
ncbi:MAG: LysM peptidoglycan-binding domain-containing protein [Neisseria sp.]|nr:LysM peptidoglycan-binding domain-containing protein [Neisseria sp.]